MTQNLGPEGELAIAKVRQQNMGTDRFNRAHAEQGSAGVMAFGAVILLGCAAALGWADLFAAPLTLLVVTALVMLVLFVRREVQRERARSEALKAHRRQRESLRR